MPEIERKEIEDILKKYQRKLDEDLGEEEVTAEVRPGSSREYRQFKTEILPPHMTAYETLCNLSERIIKIPPDRRKEARLLESIETCHLNITPTGVTTFAMVLPVLVLVLGSGISFLVYEEVFFTLFFAIIAVSLIFPLSNLPHTLAERWRMRASNEMVLSIFYIVTYMRHTSNLERAINFAAEHLNGPLALDLKKVVWNVETEKYESIKESLDMYLESWRKYNLEFIEACHLIESSLYEGSEDRRLLMLDKALAVLLEETYEKMLHYAQNLKSPITTLHMLGIILPVLGLVILPLVVSFMEGVRWYHIAMLYDVALPAIVYYMGKSILGTRPTGYGEADISKHRRMKKYRDILITIAGFEIRLSPLWFAVIIFAVFFLLGLSPIMLNAMNCNFDYVVASEGSKTVFKTVFSDTPQCDGVVEPTATFYFLGYREAQKPDEESGEIRPIGPFGFGAAVLSVFIPVALGIAIGFYYKKRSQNLIKIRKDAKQLEDEFASALFQLGNRLGDGLPAEIAFDKVAEVMADTKSGAFFSIVSGNIKKMGVGVEQAIFDPQFGAMKYYPSNVIESSMKVLIESIKKGPQIAAQALVNVSQYIKEMHRVEERLKDLLSDIISSMKSQISFLTPVIAGIVVGITAMVSGILGQLQIQMAQIAAKTETGVGSIVSLFGDGIPTYYFQVIVGIYVVSLVYILTVITNGIENGQDKLNERFLLGRNMTKSTMLYTVVSTVIMLLFNFISSQILSATLAP
ncbi:hypothetical protein JXB02_02715 [Candidatus Woesearchaeota archaeon]|nr:hypothetical protein [Candidatus Woesearchaeota archaeon]